MEGDRASEVRGAELPERSAEPGLDEPELRALAPLCFHFYPYMVLSGVVGFSWPSPPYMTFLLFGISLLRGFPLSMLAPPGRKTADGFQQTHA